MNDFHMTVKLIPFTCQWSSNKREKGGNMAVQKCPPAPNIFLAGYFSGLAAWITIELDASRGASDYWVQRNDNQRADGFRVISILRCSSLHLHLTGACFFSSFIPPSFESWPEAWDCSWWPTGLLRGCRAPLQLSCLPEKTDLFWAVEPTRFPCKPSHSHWHDIDAQHPRQEKCNSE